MLNGDGVNSWEMQGLTPLIICAIIHLIHASPINSIIAESILLLFVVFFSYAWHI